MHDDALPSLRLRLTPEEFRRLPRNPAYKYDYLGGEAWLTPWPRHYHAVLPLPPPPPLEPPEPPAALDVRPVEEEGLDALARVFCEAFGRALPFAALPEEARGQAARECLRRTAGGEDGPWVRQASFAATDVGSGQPVGAAFVTLLPDGDPCDWDSYSWSAPPPGDLLARGLGRPHLTWIFVAPLRAAQGTGTALLGAVVRALLGLGYRQLFSTFLLGNESSMLWHWRTGFRLLPHPGSLRHISRRFHRRQAPAGRAPGP
jgi:GNAT superfamily N-acetyltransferase